MPFTHRLTRSGRRKQRQDEANAWGLLIRSLVGTPNHHEVDNLAIRALGQIVGVNRASPHYAKWREAHRRLTRRARRDRQREQAAAPPYHAWHPFVPCRVAPGTNVRATIRLAALSTRTLEDHGGGTILSAGGVPATAPKASTAQLMQHLDQTLEAIEDELLDAGTHREDHDLRAADAPPVQVLLGTEWYFRVRGRALTLAERDQILTDLEALSAKYPEWLLVPGSIYWSPDPPANPTIRVYNQAPVLYGGSLLALRTKRESHDIDSSRNVLAYQRWGMDAPTTTGAPHPFEVPAPTRALCSFRHRNLTFNVEICRDQFVGDATALYLAAGQHGADVFLLMSKGTQLTPGFAPAVNNGLLVWCDGSGAGSHQYRRVTRAQPLTHNWAAPANHPMIDYRVAFVPQRDHDVLSAHGLHESYRIEIDNAPDFAAFMGRFDQVFGPANTDPVLKAAVDGALGPLHADGLIRPFHEKGRRIQVLLGGGFLPTGHAITVGEHNVMTPYAAALVQFATEDQAVRAATVATTNARTAAINGFNVAVAATGAGVVAVPGAGYDLTLYDLVDL